MNRFFLATALLVVRGCLELHTQVTLGDGSRGNLGYLSAGKLVLSWNSASSVVAADVVDRVWRSRGDLYRISYGNKSMLVTADHPIWSHSQQSLVSLEPKATKQKYGFRHVERLTNMTSFLADDGTAVAFLEARLEQRDAEAATLTVRGHHWFFAGGILVHNQGGDDGGSDSADEEDDGEDEDDGGFPVVLAAVGGVGSLAFVGAAWKLSRQFSKGLIQQVNDMQTGPQTLPPGFPEKEPWTIVFEKGGTDPMQLEFHKDGRVTGTRSAGEKGGSWNAAGKYNLETKEVKWIESFGVQDVLAVGTMEVEPGKPVKISVSCTANMSLGPDGPRTLTSTSILPAAAVVGAAQTGNAV